MTKSAFVLRILWYYPATAALIAAYFVVRDRDQAATRAARAAELARANAQRAVMESRLKVLQARVEPELLFGALADVSRRYADSPPAAEALLDDLIAYLRVALPQMRDEASTLGRELALAAAYVRVLPAGRTGRLRLDSRIDAATAALPFPPMVLLPLVDAAAQAGAGVIKVNAATAIAAEGAADPDLTLAVTVPGRVRVAGWDPAKLADLRQIVASYFGASVTLDVAAAAERTTVALALAVPPALRTP